MHMNGLKTSLITYRRNSLAHGKNTRIYLESLEITRHLNSAHEWFKDKFDNLQKELTSSR